MKMVTKCGPLGRPEAAHPPNSLSAPCKDINCWVWICTLSTLWICTLSTLHINTIHTAYQHYPHCSWEEPDMEKATDGNIKSRLTIFSSNRSSFRSVTIFLRIYRSFFQDTFHQFLSFVFVTLAALVGNLGPNCCWCANGSKRGGNQCWIAKHYFHRANYWYYVYCANYFVHAVRNQSQCQ